MSAVPDDVRALAKKALDFRRASTGGRATLRATIEDAIMADRAARPSVPPVPDAREEDDEIKAYEAWVRAERWSATFVANGLPNDLVKMAFISGHRAAERQRLRAETGASR